eukprot:scaffold7936_cov116-Isochrysis_galbana.AAC.8
MDPGTAAISTDQSIPVSIAIDISRLPLLASCLRPQQPRPVFASAHAFTAYVCTRLSSNAHHSSPHALPTAHSHPLVLRPPLHRRRGHWPIRIRICIRPSIPRISHQHPTLTINKKINCRRLLHPPLRSGFGSYRSGWP